MDETSEPKNAYTPYGLESLLREALDALKEAKPNDRSELDRRYAVTITELEKVFAYFKTFVVLD